LEFNQNRRKWPIILEPFKATGQAISLMGTLIRLRQNFKSKEQAQNLSFSMKQKKSIFEVKKNRLTELTSSRSQD
jgi:hypothetical protein